MFVCPNPHSSDEWEEMCIVPVSKHVAQTLEMEEFKSLLSTLGMQCPSDQVYIRTQTHVLHVHSLLHRKCTGGSLQACLLTSWNKPCQPLGQEPVTLWNQVSILKPGSL